MLRLNRLTLPGLVFAAFHADVLHRVYGGSLRALQFVGPWPRKSHRPRVLRRASPFPGCRCIEVTAADGSAWQVLAGKTAEDNDRLSLKEGHSDEPWMHAADVPGSHIVVRQPGDGERLQAPSDIMNVAAGIAAFYSKAKGRRVKVHVTSCGQVSKAKGSPAGKVLLKGKVDTLHVTPLDPARLKPETAKSKTAKTSKSKKTLLNPEKEAARLASRRAFRRKCDLERRIDMMDEKIRGVDDEMALAGSDADLALELLEKRQALEAEQSALFQKWEDSREDSVMLTLRDLAGTCAEVMASMMELYRNELVDLLVPKSGGASPKRKSQNPGSAALEQKLNVRVDKSGAVQIEHLREEECKTAEALSDLLERGNQMRTVCATKMNSESSRSHLILIIRVVGVNKQTEQKLSGKLLLCDLAGSERLKKSDVSGDAQKEAIEINKSLTALGDVMESLVKGAPHVPYKNHKLTQVMSDALGGTSKTLMFVNCSPASSNYEETVMTLKFATRAKTITNDVKRKMVAKAKPMPKA
ncbi:KIN14E [Symbiodinium natans]|uniref:Kinesin-like protein n=1 Tax=Symbiodinium natans TaxID=878477 RepID=A0A812RMW9_9DINO|nr:KIN14E [Symbiodinium natans]